jgi:GDP-L-fucose synthase
MKNYNEELFVNVGSSQEISIKHLAEQIKEAVGFEGEIEWNTEMPDGTPRKLMDNSRINSFGWEPQISLEEGIKKTVQDFIQNKDTYTS